VSMTTTAQNVTMWAGDTIVLEFAITDSATDADKNLSGSSIRWVMVGYTGIVVVDKSTGDGVTITNAVGGVFQVALEPADTEELPGGVYTHEAEVTDSLGNISTVATGEIMLKASYA